MPEKVVTCSITLVVEKYENNDIVYRVILSPTRDGEVGFDVTDIDELLSELREYIRHCTP